MKKFLLFSGTNQRANIAFCRVATKYNIPFLIIANGKDDSILKSDYRENVSFIREYNRLDIEYILQVIAQVKHKDDIEQLFLVPNSEYIIRFAFENKNKLTELGVNMDCLGKREIYEQLSDKLSFYGVCESNDIRIPYIYKSDKYIYPLVVKPKEYFSSGKKIYYPAIINGKEEFETYFKDKVVEDFFIQEFVKGSSYYLFFYIGEDKDCVYAQKNILQQPQGKSMIYCKPQYFPKETYMPYLNLFKKYGYRGMIMIEIIKSKGEFYAIEANPRLWGPIQLVVDNHVPIIESYIQECGFEIDTSTDKITYDYDYFWSGGYRQAIRQFGYVVDHDKDEEKDISYLETVEIYNRPDTVQIFEEERNQ